MSSWPPPSPYQRDPQRHDLLRWYDFPVFIGVCALVVAIVLVLL